ncbi:FixH family protein [Alkalihalobacillus pseudalcaliphilus]|uniref:FixH family protein n=1 Tax=Alkalihalobacillus pseudalcaliphilus TaxID=79884 RepID=UPI00064E06E5|nr:FixH family protein [Alkalihalobacillus pseudalcaliphilus]KMK75653.1 hypothetical protein AB990_10235 [Alkalihalobacillus pseudalcaliphilus]
MQVEKVQRLPIPIQIGLVLVFVLIGGAIYSTSQLFISKEEATNWHVELIHRDQLAIGMTEHLQVLVQDKSGMPLTDKNVEVIMIENSQSYQKEYVLHHVEGGLYATDIMIPFSGSWEINAVIEDSQMYRTENWLVHVYTYHQ